MYVYESKRTIEDDNDPKVDMQHIFDTTNRFHFLHSMALIAVPLVRRPIIVSIFCKFLTLIESEMLLTLKLIRLVF